MAKNYLSGLGTRTIITANTNKFIKIHGIKLIKFIEFSLLPAEYLMQPIIWACEVRAKFGAIPH